MAEVKWIKITTNIFDDEKIKIIDTYPARDEILVIWFKLLALAGKVNQNGMLFMNSKIAYTPEMLSAIFNREVNSIKLALTTFNEFGMIEIEDNEVITISNWDKHQNVEGLDKIREQNRIRQQKHRDKKLLIECNVTDNVTVTQDNAIEEELDKSKKEQWGLLNEFSNELKTAYKDFVIMRNSIKKPLTKRALTTIINKVDKMSDIESVKIQILEQSIEHSWQTVYELKNVDFKKEGGDDMGGFTYVG